MEPENGGQFNYPVSRQLPAHNVLRIIRRIAFESVHVSRPSASSHRALRKGHAAFRKRAADPSAIEEQPKTTVQQM